MHGLGVATPAFGLQDRREMRIKASAVCGGADRGRGQPTPFGSEIPAVAESFATIGLAKRLNC